MFLEGLDALDQRIVQLLIENARMSYSDIGQAVGISRVAVKARIQALEQRGSSRNTPPSSTRRRSAARSAVTLRSKRSPTPCPK